MNKPVKTCSVAATVATATLLQSSCATIVAGGVYNCRGMTGNNTLMKTK